MKTVYDELTTEGVRRRGTRGYPHAERSVWAWWPIRFVWVRGKVWSWFGQHGVENSHLSRWVVDEQIPGEPYEVGHMEKYVARVWHFGPLKVQFGVFR